MAIGSSEGLERPRLTGAAGRVSAREQEAAVDLKEARFNRGGTTKSPQQACQSMNEL